MSKIQFLKANHNCIEHSEIFLPLFINVKDTIFESKSQRTRDGEEEEYSCLSMSKIQFLKANHNYQLKVNVDDIVVYQCQRYNF